MIATEPTIIGARRAELSRILRDKGVKHHSAVACWIEYELCGMDLDRAFRVVAQLDGDGLAAMVKRALDNPAIKVAVGLYDDRHRSAETEVREFSAEGAGVDHEFLEWARERYKLRRGDTR